MYINDAERSLLVKICYTGPAGTGKADLLRALYDHFAALMGELTEYDTQEFPPRDELEASVGADAAQKLINASEKVFDAGYDELSDAGTLVRFRTALDPRPGSYLRRLDVFCAAGPATHDTLRRYSLADADAVVFVADPRVEGLEATRQMWKDLKERYDGPLVLLTIDTIDPEELLGELDFDGPHFAVNNDFDGNLAAFETAAKLATKPFREAN